MANVNWQPYMGHRKVCTVKVRAVSCGKRRAFCLRGKPGTSSKHWRR